MKFKKESFNLFLVRLMVVAVSLLVISALVIKNGFPDVTVLAILSVATSFGMYIAYLHGRYAGTGRAIPLDKIKPEIKMKVIAHYKRSYPKVDHILVEPKCLYTNEDLEEKKMQQVVLVDVTEHLTESMILEKGEMIWVDYNGLTQFSQTQEEARI